MILKKLKISTWVGDPTNCYIVFDEKSKETMVIDPAGDVEKIETMINILKGKLKYIYLTHCHGDHISGLPGLLLSMGNGERTKSVTLIGPKGLKHVVNSLRVIAPELPFSLEFIELSEEEQTICLNGYEIDAFRVNHNIVCYGYSLRVRRQGRFSVECARAHDVPMKLWSRLQKGETIEEDGKRYVPEMVIGPERKGIKVLYSTDTRPVDAIVNYGKDADLMICEGMYGDPDKAKKAREHKHMTMEEAAKLAQRAQPKQLWLTHFSPSMIHPEQYLSAVREIYDNTRIVKDGRMVTIDFEKEEV